MTWVELQLAQLCDLLVVVQKRVSIQALVAVVDGMHSLNNCSTPLNTDTFRKQLSYVVLEYGYLQCHTRDMVAMEVRDFPAGVLSQCGACWEVGNETSSTPSVLHSTCFDVVFKTPLLQAAFDRGEEDVLPPNHKHFLPDRGVREFVNNPTCKVAPDPDKACADFHADKVCSLCTVYCAQCSHLDMHHMPCTIARTCIFQ